MSRKFSAFPSIGQFRETIKAVTHSSRYIGKDENDEPIYNNSILPSIEFIGTVKLHGTNAGVTFDKNGDLWAQSRSRVITPDNDNMGFAFFVESKKETFKEFIKNIDFKDYDFITIFGEWCGANIQGGVALTKLTKRFVIFDVKLSSSNEDIKSIYLQQDQIKLLKSVDNNIFNIYDFPTYLITVDFNRPELVQNQIIDLTLAVEEECPFSKEFGVSGIGEGIVFSYTTTEGDKYRFKSKGVKHSSSKIKTLASVNVDKIKSIDDFVEYAVTENRLEQGFKEVFGEDKADIKRIGEFLKWMMSDIIKEETDTLSENGLFPKDISSVVNTKCKQWFLRKL